MALKDELVFILEIIKNEARLLELNHELYEVHEGDLLKYVERALKRQLSEKSYEHAKDRIAPINVLKRLMDKLSKIYARPPRRDVIGGGDNDKELVAYYETEMDFNQTMIEANKMFNLHKSVAIEPYLDEGKPRLRVVPFDRYMPYSSSLVNRQKMTHFTKIMGQRKIQDKGTPDRYYTTRIYYVYSDEEFLIVDEGGAVQNDMMALLYNDGVNEYGKVPAVVITRSKFELVPLPDTDTLAMTILIVILLSDLNYAVKFQCFSIIYGINVKPDGLVMSPNSFWTFATNSENPELKPEIGSIKPEVDIAQVLNLIQAEVGMWLQSRNIKPGSLGRVMNDDMASGISKILDEVDTSEDRQEQVGYFTSGEADLWNLIINFMHPVWIKDPEFKNKMEFTPGVLISTTFPEQKPIIDRGAEVDTGIKERDAGWTTDEIVIKRLNPDMTDDEVQELMDAIAAQKAKKQADALAHATALGAANPAKPADPNAPPAAGAAAANGGNPVVTDLAVTAPSVKV